jgi:hypothetical protein
MDVFIIAMAQVLQIFSPFPSHGRSLTIGKTSMILRIPPAATEEVSGS